MMSRLAIAVFAAISLLGAGITWGVHTTETAGRQAAFDRVLREAAGLVETRIEQHIALLTATRAFVMTGRDLPDREAFATFVQELGLEGPYSGLQGIGLARILAPGEEVEVQAEILQEYGVDRGVWPELVPGLRTAIVLLEPADARNRAAIGFDMSTEERRRAAMLRALAMDAAAATAPLTLVQEITEDQQTGILIYLPLTGDAERGFQGFVYAPVRMGDLFKAALEGHVFPMELRAIDTIDPDLPLFVTPGFEAAQGQDRLSSRIALSVAGRDWILAGLADPDFGAAKRLRYTVLSAVAFSLLAIAAALAVYWQGTAIHRARAVAQAAQHNIEQKDLLLREMSHRIKNALARVSAIAHQSAREATTKEDMVESLGSRLRAMAAAQDLLVRSGSDSADLADLLGLELAQIYGEATTPDLMSGPMVRLDANQAHALSLVFHELATNALKYGAGSQPGGELRITWMTAPGPSGPELLLTWDERTPEVDTPQDAGAPAGSSGFGTRLIDVSVERELGGSLTRRHHGSGLTIEIRIPLA